MEQENCYQPFEESFLVPSSPSVDTLERTMSYYHWHLWLNGKMNINSLTDIENLHLPLFCLFIMLIMLQKPIKRDLNFSIVAKLVVPVLCHTTKLIVRLSSQDAVAIKLVVWSFQMMFQNVILVSLSSYI